MSTTVRLKFVDVLGAPLDDHTVTVDIFSLDNIRHFQTIVPLSGQTDVAIKLDDAPMGVYRFLLSPTNYQVIQFFLTLPPDGTVVRKKPVIFPVDPEQIIDIAAPPFGSLPQKLQQFLNSAKVQTNGTVTSDGAPTVVGEELYTALPPTLKAALLNLFLKSSNTILGDGSNCFDHVLTLRELDQDRFFATIDAALLKDVTDSHQFHSVDFSLHKEILGYKLFASYKTRDSQGNLQLTLSRKDPAGNDSLVDMDIDEAQGIAHVFEVIGNVFTGLTNPYNVREILTAAQGLRPLYSFVFPEKKAATVAAAAAS
jgi:hypothetical protein